jgi:hypothetical protein
LLDRADWLRGGAAGARYGLGSSGRNEALEIATTPAEIAYLEAWPEGQKEVLRALLYNALTRSPRVPVMFAWRAKYDYQLTIHETAAPEALRVMTVVLGSRYPGDPHPDRGGPVG